MTAILNNASREDSLKINTFNQCPTLRLSVGTPSSLVWVTNFAQARRDAVPREHISLSRESGIVASITPENTCGKAGLGYIDTGYPWPRCVSNLWQLSAAAVNGISSASRSGQAVALNGNGTVLAVADPGLSIVRLFDKDGAEWKQRGQHIQGVGAPKASLVRVFTCTTDGCIQKGGDIFGGLGFGSSLSVSENGESLVVSRRTATNGEVAVFTLSNDTWEQRGSVAIAAPSSRKLSDSPYQFRLQDYYVSLSGDDLAVGTLELEGKAVKLITQVFKWNNSTGWDPSGNHSKHVELATLADLG
eukprot:scaffold2596_cov126-Skeletonema_dohrnii-CCMP3373.AAC.5